MINGHLKYKFILLFFFKLSSILLYAQTPKYYSNITAMQSDDTLSLNSIAITWGYYSRGDGGAGTYEIVNSGTVDGGSIILLNNGLKAKLLINNSTINVKQFGAKIDGSDTYSHINAALQFAALGKYTLYMPNGEYTISNTLRVSTDINSSAADRLISLKGESINGVKIKYTNVSNSEAIDFSRSKVVQIENITSDKYIKLIQYGGDFISYSQKREVYAQNVYCTDEMQGHAINWGLLLNTPKPSSYNTADGEYSRYPLEITNNSGYNGIMINNFAYEGTQIASPVDNSAIGIIDRVNNNAGSLLIDGGYRPFLVFQGITPYANTMINRAVFTVSPVGRIGINASHYYADPQAPGTYSLKVRDEKPSIAFYDVNNSNKYVYIEYSGNYLNFVDSDGNLLLKIGTQANVIEEMPSGGVASTITVRDASSQRGIRFWRLSTSPGGEKNRLLYTDSNNDLRTISHAESSNDKDGLLIQSNVNGGVRPTLRNSTYDKGYMFFDATLGIPIWWNGINWVDAQGQKR